MDNKTFSIISYITIIGWLVAYFGGKDNADDLLKYHLRQSLGLVIVSFLFGVATNIVAMLVPVVGMILSVASIIFLVLLVIGIINAANEVKKPLPIIGKMFEDKFSFIG